MLRLVTALSILACSLLCDAAFTEEDGVSVLTKDNFQDALNETEYILVNFYAPWCGASLALFPEYVKVAESLKKAGSPIRLAKVDVKQESELAYEHGIRLLPTLKFFKSGNPVPYSGRRTSQAIVSWLTENMGPTTTTFSTVEKTTNKTTLADFNLDLEKVLRKAAEENEI